MKTIFPQNYVRVLRSTCHMVSFIDFYYTNVVTWHTVSLGYLWLHKVQQPPLSLLFRRNNMQLKNSGHGTFQLSKISEKFILLRMEMAIWYFNGIHRLLNRFISLSTVIKAMCSPCLEISSDTYLPTPRVNIVHYFLLAHELSAV